MASSSSILHQSRETQIAIPFYTEGEASILVWGKLRSITADQGKKGDELISRFSGLSLAADFASVDDFGATLDAAFQLGIDAHPRSLAGTLRCDKPLPDVRPPSILQSSLRKIRSLVAQPASSSGARPREAHPCPISPIERTKTPPESTTTPVSRPQTYTQATPRAPSSGSFHYSRQLSLDPSSPVDFLSELEPSSPSSIHPSDSLCSTSAVSPWLDIRLLTPPPSVSCDSCNFSSTSSNVSIAPVDNSSWESTDDPFANLTGVTVVSRRSEFHSGTLSRRARTRRARSLASDRTSSADGTGNFSLPVSPTYYSPPLPQVSSSMPSPSSRPRSFRP